MAKFFWDAYDYIGKLILANIIFSFIMGGLMAAVTTVFYPIYTGMDRSLVVVAVGIGLFLIISLPFPAAGFLYFFTPVTSDKEPELRDFLKGLKRHYWPLLKITAVFVLVIELLAVNIIFYIHPSIIPHSLKMIATIISGLCLWIFLYVAVMMLYAYPLCVYQGVGIKKVFVRSFILVMDNIGVSAASFIMLIGLLGVVIITKGVAFFILAPALTASLSNSLYVNVMEKYEIREAQKEGGEEEDEPRPASWKDIKDPQFIQDRHKRYKRSLRDILKPWEY